MTLSRFIPSVLRRTRPCKAAQTLSPYIEDFDRRIEEARANHGPVAHIQKEKTDFLHDQLKGVPSLRYGGKRG